MVLFVYKANNNGYYELLLVGVMFLDAPTTKQETI